MNHPASTVAIGFEELVRTYMGRIRRIARQYATGTSVDDLVQDILTRLWRSYPTFRGDARLESWIYRVALNASMTHVSEIIRRRDLHEAISSQMTHARVPQASGSTEDILSGFLAQLGEVDASILMMYMDGFSAHEMSDVLGISSNAISVRINRLKQKFSDMYVDSEVSR